jgi:hypothetical protein
MNTQTKMGFPEPKLSPVERLRRRLSFRNDLKFYNRKCDQTGQPMISMYAPDNGFIVYEQEVWWGDTWDATNYARDYDFNRPFFEQIDELNRAVPHPNLVTTNTENAKYTNYNTSNKNCYMCAAGNYLEDSYYCYNAQNSKDCCDCYFVWDCENCYECVHCTNCYSCQFALHSQNCSNSKFIEECRNCKDCFLCFGLEHKQYCILNNQYTKEEYELEMKKYENIEETYKLWREESAKHKKKENHNVNTENCTGEYIINSKNCSNCYIMSKGCEDCKYVFNGFPRLKDSSDTCYSGEDTELLYECIASGANGGNLAFCNLCFNSPYSLAYCHYVINSKNCFGSVGLRNKEYCILNKQYSKEEYLEILPRIITHMKSTGEWGEFFDQKYSPFGYNETVASDILPLSKEEALAKGYKWRDQEDASTQEARELPEGVITCSESGKPFRIVEQEKRFYKRNNLPEPTKCFDVRHKVRLGLRQPMPKWE